MRRQTKRTYRKERGGRGVWLAIGICLPGEFCTGQLAAFLRPESRHDGVVTI